MKIHGHKEILSRFVDGDLSADEMSAVQSHLDGCAMCRVVVDSYKTINVLARDADTVLPAVPFAAPRQNIIRFPLPSRYVRAAALVVVAVCATIGVMQFLPQGQGAPLTVIESPNAVRVPSMPLGAISYYDGVVGSGVVSTGYVQVSMEPMGAMFEKTMGE